MPGGVSKERIDLLRLLAATDEGEEAARSELAAVASDLSTLAEYLSRIRESLRAGSYLSQEVERLRRKVILPAAVLTRLLAGQPSAGKRDG